MSPSSRSELLRELYARFNARQIDPILAVFTPDVEWPRAWEGDFVRGHEAIRAYWTHQWSEIDPRVDPIGFEPLPDERVRVRVAQTVRDRQDNLLFDGEVRHVYTFDGDLVARMEIESPDAS